MPKRAREPKIPTIPFTPADVRAVEDVLNEAVMAHAKRHARAIRWHLYRGMSLQRLETIYGAAAVKYARLISR